MANATKLQFAELEPVGPGTPSGRYLRRFWQPSLSRAGFAGWKCTSRSSTWARNSRSIAARAAPRMSSDSAARIAGRSSRWAGSRATVCAAATMAGNMTARASASSSQTRTSLSRRRCACRPIDAGICRPCLRLPRRRRAAAFSALSRPLIARVLSSPTRRDHPLLLLEPARQRHRAYPVGPPRDGAAQGRTISSSRGARWWRRPHTAG